MPPLCLLPRRIGGGQLPFKAHASVRFLSEPIFERRLTRRGRGQILCCLLLRGLRFSSACVRARCARQPVASRAPALARCECLRPLPRRERSRLTRRERSGVRVCLEFARAEALRSAASSRLKFRESACRRVCLLPRSVGGGQLPFKAHAPVRFLSEPIFERRLTRRGRSQILCCLLLRGLRFAQRAFERGSRGSRVRQSSGQLGFDAGDLPGGRCRVRYALPTGSLEGGCGFRRLPLECGAGSGLLGQRGVVSRLKFRELRSVPPFCLLMRSLHGREVPVETRAPVNFLAEQVVEHRLALVRGGHIDRGALPRVLMRSIRFCESDFERGSRSGGFSQAGSEFRFPPAEVIGGGGRVSPAPLSRRIEGTRGTTQFSGQRITRTRGLRQARRELRVALRELVGERDGL